MINLFKKEKKGYYQGENDNNQLIKALNQISGTIDFSKFQFEEMKEVYKSNAVVYGIIDKIASSTSELLKYVEAQDEKDNVIASKLLDVLKNPNDRDSGKKFIKAWAIERLIYGNAFVYTENNIGSNRDLKSLYIIPTYKVQIEKGGWKEPIKGITIGTESIPKENYFQSFLYNPDADTYFGLSPLQVAASDVQLIQKGKLRMNTTIQNGAVSSIITPAKDGTGVVVPQAANELEEALNNVSNANKIKFVRQAIETHSLGSTPVELGILDTSKDSVTALCFAYNIPVDLYYGQSKYENAREAKKALYQFAAIPLMNEFLEDFLTFVKRGKVKVKEKLVINIDQIEELRSSQTEVMTNLVSMNASLNEKREYMGYPPIAESWADEPIIPLGIQFGNETIDMNENI